MSGERAAGHGTADDRIAAPPSTEAVTSGARVATWARAIAGWRPDRVTWIVLAIVAVAAVLRIWDLGAKAIHHDESLHATYSWYFVRLAPIYKHDPLMHGPWQFHAMAAVFKLLGDNDFTARIPAAIAGTALVATPLLLRRWLLPAGTVLASLLLTLSPSILYYSRFAREDIHIALWTVLLFVGVWRYRDDGRDRWLALVAASLALSFATKESVYLTAAILLLYCDVTLTTALLDQRGTTGRARWREGLLLAPVAWLLAALWYALVPLRARLRFSSLPREGDLLVVLGILTLPQLAAGVQIPLSLLGVTVEGQTERWIAVVTISSLLGLATMVGMFWHTPRWALVSLIFYGITIPLFTTEFTNLRGGITSDLWGALDYWIAQQGVRRGEQPWFYYLMMLPLYEFLVLIPAIVGGWWLLERRHGFAALLVWWSVGTFAALSYAGEKMPWLVIHLAIPLVLLAALSAAEALAWLRAHRGRAGMAGRLAPAGTALAVVLAAVSVRTALGVSFDHPDTPIEPLIYTQTAPEVPRLSKEIHALAAQQPDRRLTVVVDDAEGASWPWAWYLRDLPGTSYTPASVLAQTWQPGAVMLVLKGDAESPELRARTGVGRPYHHRWWFPEEGYRAMNGWKLFTGVITGRLFVRWAEFQWKHVPVSSLGSLEGEAIFPADAPGAGGGPQPAPPR